MNPKTRERVTKALVEALSKAGLSRNEAEELSIDMARNAALLTNFSQILKTASRQIKGDQPTKSSSVPISETYDQYVSAFETIQRQRLSKSDVLELIFKASPKAKRKDVHPTASLRELVREFFDTASDSDIEKFLTNLRRQYTDDAYLQGITRRG